MEVKKLYKIILPVGKIILFIYCGWQGLMTQTNIIISASIK